MMEALNWTIKWTGDSITTAICYEHVAHAELLMGDYTKAITYLENSRRICNSLRLKTEWYDRAIELVNEVIAGNSTIEIDYINETIQFKSKE